MASDADTTYKATAPAVSSRALKCYTACYDGKLEEVKRVVNQPNQPKLDVNAEIHGGTATFIDQNHLATRFVRCLNGCKQLSPWLLTLIHTQFSLLRRKHGLEQNHRGFAFFDDPQQALFVQPAVIDQRIVATLAKLNGDDIGFVRLDL